MTHSVAAEAKSKSTMFYAFGVAAFTGGMSVVAMFLWLVYHVK
jgi:hypothetical protein